MRHSLPVPSRVGHVHVWHQWGPGVLKCWYCTSVVQPPKDNVVWDHVTVGVYQGHWTPDVADLKQFHY